MGKAAPTQAPTACTNLSTSRMLEDVAKRFGGRVVRAKVGEAHVVDAMEANAAAIGGEGNGGVIEPKVGYVRDSFVGMAYVLDGLAKRAQPLSDWVDTLPKYVIVKDKLHCPRHKVTAACEALKLIYGDAEATEGDAFQRLYRS